MFSLTLPLIALCFSTPFMAHSQTSTGTISGTVTDSESPKLILHVCKGNNVHAAPAIDADIKFNANDAIDGLEEIEVITGAYDAKYEPQVEEARIQSKSELGRYVVHGHPRGSYTLIFTALDEGTTTTAEGGWSSPSLIQLRFSNPAISFIRSVKTSDLFLSILSPSL